MNTGKKPRGKKKKKKVSFSVKNIFLLKSHFLSLKIPQKNMGHSYFSNVDVIFSLVSSATGFRVALSLVCLVSFGGSQDSGWPPLL